jgi:hypothetical protein
VALKTVSVAALAAVYLAAPLDVVSLAVIAGGTLPGDVTAEIDRLRDGPLALRRQPAIPFGQRGRARADLPAVRCDL